MLVVPVLQLLFVACVTMFTPVTSWLKARPLFSGRPRMMCTSRAGRYIETITSTANPKVKLLKSVAEKKTKREEFRLVLVEGQRVILDALDAGAVPKHVLFTERAFQSPLGARLNEAIVKLPSDCSVNKVSESALSYLSETIADQGIIAAFLLPRTDHGRIQGLIATKQQPMLLALDGVRDPGNMGTLLRTAYGLGADAVACIDGCDIWSPKVLRSSTGVQLTCSNTMPIGEYKNWQQLHEALRTRENTINASAVKTSASFVSSSSGSHSEASICITSLPAAQITAPSMQIVIADGHTDSVPFTDVDFTLPTVIVIGSEAEGVSEAARQAPGKAYSSTVFTCYVLNHTLSRYSGTVIHTRIPLLRKLESFNAAVAGSILLAEAARQRSVERR
jgi:TrmH family RNA methyltransferase